MKNQVLAFNVAFEVACQCSKCDVPVVMSSGHTQSLKRSHEKFYCVNGHAQHWPSESDVEALQKQLEAKERDLVFERQRAATNFNARQHAEKKLEKIERRTSGGVCPCCSRTFVALGRHMKTKHADFVKDASSE